MKTRTFSDFLSHMETTGIASRKELIGCTPDEIAILESRYSLVLPEAYRNYLAVMGHSSGRLLTHDHYAARYEHVLQMTEEYREFIDEYPDEPHVTLPPDALTIVGRLGQQFLMIRCNQANDSKVWYFNDESANLREVYSSVMDWLYSTAKEAKDAIDGGYYDWFPNGTRP